MLKKTMIAVLGLASGFATAGVMGPVCTPGNVTVPCEMRLWDLGADALYFRSIFGANKGYQFRFNPAREINPVLKDVKNDWNWGFRIVGSYHFNTGNDVTMNWTHFSSTSRYGNILAPLPFEGTLVRFPAFFGANNRFDQANIVLGQHVDFSPHDRMRFYGGMQYANIQSMGQTYIVNPLIALVTEGSPINIFNNTSFQGIGPSIGVDYSYDLFNGLSLTANGSGSLVYGTARYHEGVVVTNFSLIQAQVSTLKRAIVPSLEAKLGLNYAYHFREIMVNIDAGYQAINYFNALITQQFQVLTNLPTSSVHYGLFGPYFGMKLVGNA
jgi:hypothetical protein